MPNERYVCRCGVDVHAHVVPESFPAYTGSARDVRWPSMAQAGACHRHVMLSGKVYRTVSSQCWDSGVRLADMDASGVGRQVLSPMPELLAYWLDPEDGSMLSRFLNERMAGMVAAAPARFSALGAVPLQDIDRAITELELAVRQFGLSGVEIGSNVNGVPVGDPRFLPFFQAAAELGAAIFVHALRPAGMERLVGPPSLEQLVAFPGEIGLATMSMITGGLLRQVPALRIAFSHGGGSIRVLVPRLQHAWQASAPLKEMIPQSPLEQVRRLYFDDLLYDADAIRSLIGLVGDTQVMAGTDYPFLIMDPDPAGRLESLAVDADVHRRLSAGNAERWLALSGG